MYLPKRQTGPKRNPFRVEYSYRFMYTTACMLLFCGGAAAVYASRQVQQRERRTQRELRMQRPGQRVVIVGAGPGGCALAASLCNSSPDLHVTVVERERRQTFMGAYALAHVGHRSYDLNTSGGVDFLRSPTSWNVTRDASLVAGEVVRVLTGTQEVVVAPAQTAAAVFSASPPTPTGGAGLESTPPTQGWTLSRLWGPRTAAAAAEDASAATTSTAAPTLPYRALADGTHAYPYDVLVLACGARRTLGPLENLLPHGLDDIDRYGIAVNPGTTRDTLGHLFQGNILHVKVPPKSFCAQLEAERRAKGARPPALVLYDGSRRTSGTTEDAAFFEVMDRLSGLRATAGEEGGGGGGGHPVDGALSAPLHPYMRWASRQHDSTFASATNTLWKYLDYFSKLNYCQLISVTADADPLGPAPVVVNDIVRSFWRVRHNLRQHAVRQSQAAQDTSHPEGERQLSEMEVTPSGLSDVVFLVGTPGSREKTMVVRLPETERDGASTSSAASPTVTSAAVPSRAAHFHFLNHSYPTAIDPDHQLVTLYNYAHHVLLTVPYRLLLLDLPLKAPAFIAESGLGRGPRILRESAASSPLRGRAAVAAFEDDASFADVDPATLQHRVFENIFALGDAAGLPTAKSYGATLAQVPVVAHNVRQQLYNQRAGTKLAAQEARYKQELAAYEREHGGARGLLASLLHRAKAAPETQPPPPSKPSTEWFKPRAMNALYDGYASYHVVMTTWRAMWPEMTMGLEDVKAGRATGDTAQESSLELTRRLRHCDNHVWSNLAWWDVRGLANGVFCQMSLYEHMQFFAFNRGIWYPPQWFSVPTFSATDGTPQRASHWWTSFL